VVENRFHYTLAEADVPDLALGHHLFQLEPSRIWVRGQCLVVARLVPIHCNGPVHPAHEDINYFLEKIDEDVLGLSRSVCIPVNEIKIKIIGPKFSECVVKSRFDILWRMKGVPELLSERYRYMHHM
jgi:hypothetical protein